MSKMRWMFCLDCTHRYCEFCYTGEKYEKKQYNKEENEEDKDEEQC